MNSPTPDDNLQPRFSPDSVSLSVQEALVRTAKNTTECAIMSTELYVSRVTLSRSLGFYQGRPPEELVWSMEDCQSARAVFAFVEGLELQDAIDQTICYLRALNRANKEAADAIAKILSARLGIEDDASSKSIWGKEDENN